MHVNALDRTRRNAQLTSGALVDDHGVHLLRRTHDGIHRTGLDAQGAADAFFLDDIGDRFRLFNRTGPSTEPWGTPPFTLGQKEGTLVRSTRDYGFSWGDK